MTRTSPIREPRRRRNAPVFARYVLLEIPGWFAAGIVLTLLVRYWELSPRIALLLFGLWVLKDFALFPVLRVAYEDGSPNATDAMIGSLGTVRERLDPDGWVLVGAELWRAELAAGQAAIEPGTAVRVLAVRDLTLRVEPA
jgi:membrane-bound ClpP family serine protease